MSDALTYLMGNRWTKDAEGEFITVEDSHAVPPVSLSVDGKSTQVTTTGKNILPDFIGEEGFVEGFGFTLSNNNTVATVVEDTSKAIYVIPWMANTSIVMRRGIAGNPAIQLAWFESRPTLGSSGKYKRVMNTSANTNIAASGETVDGYAAFLIQKANINGVSSTEAQAEFGNSSTAYEPYTGGKPSPSPDYPQEITSVVNPVATFAGKNLASPATTASSTTSNGITFNWDGEKLVASGTSNANNTDSMSVVIDNTPILFAGITYKFSFQGTFDIGSSKTTFYFNTSKQGETSLTLHYLFGAAGANSWTYTPTEDVVLRRLSLRISNSGTTVNISANLQLEIGSTATAYEPYQGQSIQLYDGTLRSLPNGTKDELHLTYLRPSDRTGWAWYSRELVKRVAEFIADGVDEGWKRNHETVYYRTSTLCKVAVSGAVEFMSPQFAPATTRSLAQARNAPANSILGRTGENDMVLRTGVAYETLADFTAWLSENPVTIYYPLETPVVTELDPIELPAMQSGLTNVWSDPSTNLSITYERDRNIVISNMKAALDDLATS